MTKESKAPREFWISPRDGYYLESPPIHPHQRMDIIHVIEYSAYQQLEEKLNYYKDHAEMMKEAWDKAEDKLRAAVEALEALLNDSQHSDHECGDDRCPVDSARKVLTKLKGGEK